MPPQPLALDKPMIPVMLGNIDGGQTNLLPRSAQSVPLRLNLGRWADGDDISTVSILLDGDVVPGADKNFPAGVPDNDRFITLPAEFFSADGRYSVAYRVTNTLGSGDSDAEQFEVDLTAPQLPVDSAPRFPQTDITEKYLEDHGNEVVVTLPDYTDIWAGDTIHYSLSRMAGSPNIVGSKTWTRAEIDAPPLTYILKGEDFIQLGDGDHFALYSVTDRAGNLSANSLITTLQVSATPKPRWLPHPTIIEASGSGNSQSLNPKSVSGDLTVAIPNDAVIKEGDKLTALWGLPGTPGAEQTIPQSEINTFTIPFAWFPGQIGKTISVIYQVVDGDTVLAKSDALSLTVEKITQREFGPISCTAPELSGLKMKLSAAATTGGAHFAVNSAWPFMAAGQRFTVKVEGIQNNNTPIISMLLDNHIVTQQEVENGKISTKLEYSKLSIYKINQPFSVETMISYDGGTSWLSFETLRITLEE